MNRTKTKKTAYRKLIIALCAMVVLVALLVPATMAWFTVSISNTHNVIKSADFDFAVQNRFTALKEPETEVEQESEDKSEGVNVLQKMMAPLANAIKQYEEPQTICPFISSINTDISSITFGPGKHEIEIIPYGDAKKGYVKLYLDESNDGNWLSEMFDAFPIVIHFVKYNDEYIADPITTPLKYSFEVESGTELIVNIEYGFDE